VSKFVAFLKEDTGATAIEYGLVAAGISLAIIVVVNAIAITLNGKLDNIASQ
jgi:pilus assembly protein Flp/PilA